MEAKKIKGYKGFDKDLKCRGFQYEIGKEYQCDGEVECCENGFHFCENPFDVFDYYAPADSRYCKVEGSGDIRRDGGDTKVAVSNIRVEAEIGLKGIIEAGVKLIMSKVSLEDKSTNTGDYSAATNTGNRSAATNTGNQSAATNTGDRSAATNTGEQSAATNTGYRSAATLPLTRATVPLPLTRATSPLPLTRATSPLPLTRATVPLPLTRANSPLRVYQVRNL